MLADFALYQNAESLRPLQGWVFFSIEGILNQNSKVFSLLPLRLVLHLDSQLYTLLRSLL